MIPEKDSPEDVGSIEDWAAVIGTDDAGQLLGALGALGGSQELVEQLAAAIIPGAAQPTLAGAASPQAATLSPEEQRRRTEARFRLLVENLPCVAFVAGMGQGGSEVYINPYIEQLLGYSREEWLRDPFLWYWRLHPDDRAMWNREFARGLVGGGPWQADCRFLAADGRSVWVRGHARIVRDDQGRPLFLQGIAFDITGLKEEERQTLQQRDDAVEALAALPQAIVAVAGDDRLIAVTPAARDHLGLAGNPATLAELLKGLDPATGAPLADLVARCRASRAPADAPLGGAATLIARGRPLPAATGVRSGVLLQLESAGTTRPAAS